MDATVHKLIPKANLAPPAEGGLIVCGDCVEWLQWLPDESIDLCYIAPPFSSYRNYEVIWGNGFEVRAFGDRFSGGVQHYVEWMRERVALIHKKLKPTGSIFLHCDGHASHRLRVMLDDIFGERAYVNEIVWKRQSSHNNAKQGSKHFGRLHDNILFYSKSPSYFFRNLYQTHDSEYVRKAYRHADADGRRYRLDNLTGPGGAAKGNPSYEVMGVTRYWRYTREKMKNLIAEGRIVQSKPGGVPAFKRYLDESKGAPLQDVWTDVEVLQSNSKERLGYPTQKPVALVKRIIECASNEGGVVLDCFGGGGTTAMACVETNRRFITGDVSPVAVKMMSDRLTRSTFQVPFEVKNLARTEEEFKEMDGHAFAAIVCEVQGWKCNERKSGDGGIDGWDGYGYAVQVKNHKSKAGRPDLQRFASAIRSSKGKSNRGVFVSWAFSPEAKEYAAQLKSEEGVTIELLQCKDIFGSLILAPEKAAEIAHLYGERKPSEWGADDSTVVKKKPVRKKAS
jgi:DNA modification methylase